MRLRHSTFCILHSTLALALCAFAPIARAAKKISFTHFSVERRVFCIDAGPPVPLVVSNIPSAIAPAQSRDIDPDDQKTWKLVWEDEFNYKDRADLLKVWESANGPFSHILCSRWEENIEVGNGVVRLVNRKESRGGQDWTSGHMATRRNFLYGYFECRYKYAASTRTNNSFWIMTRHGDPEPAVGKRFEIDINEGHYPDKVNTAIHNWSDITVKPDGKQTHPSFGKSFHYKDKDFSKEYHLFGLAWTKDELIFYLDRKEIRRKKMNSAFPRPPLCLASPFSNGGLKSPTDSTAHSWRLIT